MPIGVLTRVEVFDAHLYAPGGMVNKWMRKLGTRFGQNARAAAPSRSGRLRKGIRVTYRRRGTKQVSATIGSTAEHTMAVIRGTTGPIMSNTAWAAGGPQYEGGGRGGPPRLKVGHGMAVGRNPWPPVTPRGIVSGQRSNNFFYPAWVATARVHPSIRGVPFPRSLR